jgi:hypothetical protein
MRITLLLVAAQTLSERNWRLNANIFESIATNQP